MAKRKRAAVAAPLSEQVSKPNPVAIRFSIEEREWLRRRGTKTGTSLNRLVQTAVAQYMRRIDAAELRKVARATSD